MLDPDQQRDLGDLIRIDPAAAEKTFRQLAENFATQHFGPGISPQNPQEIAELVPMIIGLCAQQADDPAASGRVQQMQHAARAAFYERLRSLVAATESVEKGGSA